MSQPHDVPGAASAASAASSDVPAGVPERAGDSAAAFEESPAIKIWRLERALADARRHGAKATRQLHRRLSADLRAEFRSELRAARQATRAAERRAERAEQAAKVARRRARQAEQEVAALKASRTWRTGRAVLVLPSRIKRWGRS